MNRFVCVPIGCMAVLWITFLCVSAVRSGPITAVGQRFEDRDSDSDGSGRPPTGDRVRVDREKAAAGHGIMAMKPVLPSSPDTSWPDMPWNRHTHTVVGTLQRHVVSGRETLLDIARAYDLGFNEMEDLYPGMDPWLPPVGAVLTIPSRWVLPASTRSELVVNVAELRLYRFRQEAGATTVETFPVGIGDLDWPTPRGEYQINTKVTHPAWVIPASLRAKYGRTVIPPGPDNPLGDYWMRLGGTSYGIHGTDLPWSVGRLVTHGCIRLYPEDIAYLFHSLGLPAEVRLIYEPVKIGMADGRIYVEVHRDVYHRIADFKAYGFQRLAASKWRHSVDRDAFSDALEERRGLPVDVTAGAIARPVLEPGAQ